MKIVGFEHEGELRLGVVERDEVIDIQAGDASIPADLGELLRRANGDLATLNEAARRAPAMLSRC